MSGAIRALLAGLACLAGTSGAGLVAGERRGVQAGKAPPAWRKLLDAPATQPAQLPRDWKRAPIPEGFKPVPGGGGASGGGGDATRVTVDLLMRESDIVVAGVCVGNDGSFSREIYAGAGVYDQYTTYYLRVEGYAKDAARRRPPFLKVLAPGGFLTGSNIFTADLQLPYLETNKRYLLYLTRNTGVKWGLKNAVVAAGTPQIGRGDEYWTTRRLSGRFYEDAAGKLNGHVFDEWEWEGLGMMLPFGKAVERVTQAAMRERKGLPPAGPQLPTGVNAEYRAYLLEHKAEYDRQRNPAKQ